MDSNRKRQSITEAQRTRSCFDLQDSQSAVLNREHEGLHVTVAPVLVDNVNVRLLVAVKQTGQKLTRDCECSHWCSCAAVYRGALG